MKTLSRTLLFLRHPTPLIPQPFAPSSAIDSHAPPNPQTPTPSVPFRFPLFYKPLSLYPPLPLSLYSPPNQILKSISLLHPFAPRCHSSRSPPPIPDINGTPHPCRNPNARPIPLSRKLPPFTPSARHNSPTAPVSPGCTPAFLCLRSIKCLMQPPCFP